MTDAKKSILFVPAWWPCGFFMDQQEVTSDEYTPFVLYGKCDIVSRRKYTHSLFPKPSYKEFIKGNECKISFQWVKFHQTFALSRQKQHLQHKVTETINNLICEKKPTLVHIQSISETAVFVMDWAETNHIPVIITEHLIYIRRNIDYLTQLKESLYQRANQVLCVSNYLYRNLLTTGFNMRKVQVIGNMIDDRFVPNDFDKIKKNGRIMFVASHLHDKDFGVLVTVAQKLRDSGKKIDVYGLTGKECIPGELTAEEQVRKGKVENVIQFMGCVSHQELLQTYPQYSLLISTSRSETFGLSVAESIAYGTPVVCTDSGGIRDFVSESNGVVVGIGEVERIAQIILQSNTIFSKMCYSALDIHSKFGVDVYKNKLLNLYSLL